MTHHRYRVVVLAVCCSLLGSAFARAAIKTEVKTSTPLSGDAKATIALAIKDSTSKLAAAVTANDPTLELAARKSFSDDADTTGTIASKDYQTEYALAVKGALGPVLQPQTDPVQKLNAAIVVANVAGRVARTQSADVLVPLIQTMLKDKYWPVVYWGLKASRYALASAVQNSQGTGQKAIPLTADIIAAVKANEKSGQIIDEAYQALVLEPIPKTDLGIDADIALVLPSLLDVIEWRTTLYAAGAPPVSPNAEAIPANVLPLYAFKTISDPANAALKKRVLKALGDLTTAQLTAIQAAAPAPDADLIDGAIRLGNALTAFGAKLNDAGLQTAGLEISKMGSTPAAATVAKNLTLLQQALANPGPSAAQ